jgi:hypothetical protein
LLESQQEWFGREQERFISEQEWMNNEDNEAVLKLITLLTLVIILLLVSTTRVANN